MPGSWAQTEAFPRMNTHSSKTAQSCHNGGLLKRRTLEPWARSALTLYLYGFITDNMCAQTQDTGWWEPHRPLGGGGSSRRRSNVIGGVTFGSCILPLWGPGGPAPSVDPDRASSPGTRVCIPGNNPELFLTSCCTSDLGGVTPAEPEGLLCCLSLFPNKLQRNVSLPRDASNVWKMIYRCCFAWDLFI